MDIDFSAPQARSQMAFQRICAWSSIAFLVLFFGAIVSAGFLPPLSPSLSPAEVAHHYQTHAIGVRVGSGLMVLSGMFFVVSAAVTSGQMRRIPGLHPTVPYAQLAAGAAACIAWFIPAMLFATTAYRPDRPVLDTQMLNDLSWILFLMPWPPLMAQNFSFAFAIFSDHRAKPLFPRWLAYLNIWAPIIFSPALAVPFFYSGPLAWSGVFVFWIPAAAIVIQLIANTRMLLAAIKDEETELAQAPRSTARLSTTDIGTQ